MAYTIKDKKASSKWYHNHKELAKYRCQRSVAKRFIRETGTYEDVLKLKKLFEERLNSYETKQQR